MKKLLYLLILTACSTNDMIIPKGNPIKFWPSTEETFNDKVVLGNIAQCYKQPFSCDRNVRVQTLDDAWELLSGWANHDPGGSTTAWTFPTTTSLRVDNLSSSANSYSQYAFVAFPTLINKTYKFYFDVTFNCDTVDEEDLFGVLSLYILDNTHTLITGEFINIVSTTELGTGEVNITGFCEIDVASSGGTYIALVAFQPDAPQLDFIVNEFYYVKNDLIVNVYDKDDVLLFTDTVVQAENGTYNYSFVPTTEGICDKVAYIELSKDGLLWYSDYLYFADHDDTVVIKYSNESNYAELDFTTDIIFELELEGKFFKERTPEENESDQTSDGTVEKLSSTLKDQKLLEIAYAPPHIHKLMKRVLNHNTIYIDGEYWVKEENYEARDVSQYQPLQPATCWLTIKEDGYDTNVYGTVTTI